MVSDGIHDRIPSFGRHKQGRSQLLGRPCRCWMKLAGT